MRKELGKISSAEFGFGGYQDAQIGLSLVFEMQGSGCGDFEGFWFGKRPESAGWDEDDRIKWLGKTVMQLGDTLRKAKVQSVDALVGVPVELTFDGNVLKEWRILEEVL